MIRERDIARIFAVALLIGLFCVGYVLLTQPTGMITHETNTEKTEKTSQKEMQQTFDEEFKQIEKQLVILGAELE